jgi:threonine dehydrogenase-like Zn-dependent dehydrogenase
LASLASGRLSTEKLVTHTIAPEEIGAAYEGLLRDKDRYLGVAVKWQ